MDTFGTRVLILGGSGLVGMAIARELIPHRPKAIVISGLTRDEAEAAVAELSPEAAAHDVSLIPEWGDVFVPRDLKDVRRAEILADPVMRARVLDDVYTTPVAEAVESSALGALLLAHTPQVVIDCINTATVFAYQNAFESAVSLRDSARDGTLSTEQVESHLATMYLPQLIRHAQIALEAMRRAGTRSYLKVGTAGTGGMGLNIPFTHSEERPSRMLLAKASVAGAHSLLLFLMARTPGAPAVKEIKPTAAISWKRIAYGEVRRRGRPMPLVDSTRPVAMAETLGASDVWREAGGTLHGVFVDAGENGLFSPAEFETLTALGLMEFITPEEIAQDVVREIRGYPTGHDIVAALDASTSGPTYRAGVLRQHAIARMDELEREHDVESIAYEMLGPPRLSKLLFEAAILGRLCDGDLRTARSLDPEDLASRARSLVSEDADLRMRILSIGFPVVLSGEEVLRGPEVRVRPEPEDGCDLERSIERGWVDLRASNWARWRDRTAAILESVRGSPTVDGGSRTDVEPWHVSHRLRPGTLAAWVFRHEDSGERIKR